MSPLVLPKVCFVCNDGACLAPIAASVYNHLSGLCSLNRYAVFAAGVKPGRCIDPMAQRALEALGIVGGTAQALCAPSMITEGIVSGCEIVVCLDRALVPMLTGRFPAYASRFTSLSGEVLPPSSGDYADYELLVRNVISLIRKDFEF